MTKTNQQQVRLRELESEAESDRAVYTAFLNRAKEVGEQQDLNDTNSRIITRAVPPTAKSSPPRTLIIAGSFILGLIGGGMIGLLREQFNSTVISARELATDFRMRVLAELSDYADAPSPVFGSESPQAEAMHRLLGVLRSRSSATGPDVTLVTSPPGSPDVRSIIALNLAVCAGEEGAHVLLVISDSHQQGATRPVAGRDSEHRRRTNFADRIVQTPWRGVEFLRLLPAGGYDRQMLDRLRDVIADTADEFDLIVIDDGLSSTESGLLRPRAFWTTSLWSWKAGIRGATSCKKGSKRSNRAGPRSPAPFWQHNGRPAPPHQTRLATQQAVDHAGAHQQRQNRYPNQDRANHCQEDHGGHKADDQHQHG